MSEPSDKPRFVWPPRQADPPQPLANLPSSNAPPPTSTLWWQAIERTWFGLTRASFAERLAESGWSPDGAADYCHRCGQSLLAGQARDIAAAGCSACRHDPTPWSQLVRLGPFDGVLRDGILEAKFEKSSGAASRLGRMMAHSLAGAMLSSGHSPTDAVLIPVPTTWWRTFRRGIDHSGRLARCVGSALGIPVSKSLGRKNTRAQVGLSAEARRRNVHRTMYLRTTVPPARLLVFVDDVITTGATLRECVRACGLKGPKADAKRAGGPEIWTLVAAAAEGPALRPSGGGDGVVPRP